MEKQPAVPYGKVGKISNPAVPYGKTGKISKPAVQYGKNDDRHNSHRGAQAKFE